MLWKSCLKSKMKNLSHRIFVSKMNIFQVKRGVDTILTPISRPQNRGIDLQSFQVVGGDGLPNLSGHFSLPSFEKTSTFLWNSFIETLGGWTDRTTWWLIECMYTNKKIKAWAGVGRARKYKQESKWLTDVKPKRSQFFCLLQFYIFFSNCPSF